MKYRKWSGATQNPRTETFSTQPGELSSQHHQFESYSDFEDKDEPDQKSAPKQSISSHKVEKYELQKVVMSNGLIAQGISHLTWLPTRTNTNI